jgi:ribosomal protein S18 acetylase RimI-like enzyme
MPSSALMPAAPAYVVRAATPPDVSAVARLAAQLVRYHHALDPSRYLLVEPIEKGYAHFLAAELANPRAVLLAGEEKATGAIVGYAYGRLEPRDWNMLLEAHGALHDVLVAPEARAKGLGEQLVREACKRLEALGAPRVILHTAVQNENAQALFERAGFRRTMIEMTRDAAGESAAPGKPKT